MDLSESYKRVIPPSILAKYDWAETRQAAAVIKASNPQEFADLIGILESFGLDENRDIKSAGGNQSATAKLLNLAFRQHGWREGRYHVRIGTKLHLRPWKAAGEKKPTVVESEADTASFQIDNLKGRVAIDVEWHAKEGHLDRDLAAYRSLYRDGVIDAAAIITMTRSELRAWALELDASSTKFQTITATSLEKARPKLQRGDAGGCPVLIVGLCRRSVLSSSDPAPQ
jgi:hypothetical protein